MKSENNIQVPLPTEHAYHLGWTAYYNDSASDLNPYDKQTDNDLYVAWVDGYDTATRVENRINKLVNK